MHAHVLPTRMLSECICLDIGRQGRGTSIWRNAMCWRSSTLCHCQLASSARERWQQCVSADDAH